MTTLAIFASPAIGIAVLLYIVIRFILDAGRASGGRGYIALKAVVSLVVWLIVSCGWLYAFFVMAYRSGPFVGLESEYGEALSVLILDLFYAVIGFALALWMRPRSNISDR